MLKVLHNWFSRLFFLLTTPTSQDKDHARREFILNILLLTSLILSVTSFIAAFSAKIIDISKGRMYTGLPPEIVFIIFIIFLISYVISRLGKSQWVSMLFIILYFFVATYTSYRWGVDVPQALLIYALIIVMSGILIGSGFAFLMTIKIVIVLTVLIYLQTLGLVHPDVSWISEGPDMYDVMIFNITFLVIATVSWLFNKEMEKSLIRARQSEMELKKERDSLEIKVEERTKELKESQIEQMSQIYRFAELGRLASGIFHDLASPISMVSLSLESLNEKSKLLHKKELNSLQEHLKRALIGTGRLESFIKAARKHIQNQDIFQEFSLREEIQQATQILHHKARKNHVSIVLEVDEDIQIYGNPIKFHQLIINFLSNAIDAYLPLKKEEVEKRIVRILYQQNKEGITIKIKDWGEGIAKEHIPHIFEPLYTTKNTEKGTGLGLSICKDIIEKHFHGTIHFESELHAGTTFTIKLPHRGNKIT